MNEIKKPKKPLIFYYTLVLVIIILINSLLVPWMAKMQIKEVDYGTFMTMTDNKEIGSRVTRSCLPIRMNLLFTKPE